MVVYLLLSVPHDQIRVRILLTGRYDHGLARSLAPSAHNGARARVIECSLRVIQYASHLLHNKQQPIQSTSIGSLLCWLPQHHDSI